MNHIIIKPFISPNIEHSFLASNSLSGAVLIHPNLVTCSMSSYNRIRGFPCPSTFYLSYVMFCSIRLQVCDSLDYIYGFSVLYYAHHDSIHGTVGCPQFIHYCLLRLQVCSNIVVSRHGVYFYTSSLNMPNAGHRSLLVFHSLSPRYFSLPSLSVVLDMHPLVLFYLTWIWRDLICPNTKF